MPDLEERIVFERALTPVDIHERYKVLNGAIYGLASHGRWNGAFKPSNKRRDPDGLFLAGGAAHPGPGMPMVLMSGWIAADALDQQYRGAEAAVSARKHAEQLSSPCLMRWFVHRGACSRSLPTISIGTSGVTFTRFRVTNASRFPSVSGPLIAYSNHASWWDPLALILFSRYFLPPRITMPLWTPLL